MFGEFEAFLSILTFVPAIGALVIALFRFTARPEDQALIDRNSRLVAWVATMVTLVLSIILVANFDRETAGFQFVHEIEWHHTQDTADAYEQAFDERQG